MTVETQTESIASVLSTLRNTLQQRGADKFSILLIGRTGVGKSSTINSLMGQEVAPVGDYEATTKAIDRYTTDLHGIECNVIDTPGLCDDVAEKGNDYDYLEMIRSQVKSFDALWFVTNLPEKRVRADEKVTIKLMTEAFGKEIWNHAVIVFTFACDPNISDYTFALQKRTELIRNVIAEYAGRAIANDVPSIAVDNTQTVLPDSTQWLGELYQATFERMKEEGIVPYLLATLPRIQKPEPKTEIVRDIVYMQPPSNPPQSLRPIDSPIILPPSSPPRILGKLTKIAKKVGKGILKVAKNLLFG